MPARLLALTALLAGLAVSNPAWALRCGTQLVVEGMSRYQVRQRCGEPQDIVRRYATVYRQITPTETIAREIEIEEWFYDLGSTRLNRRLIFVDGVLDREEIAN